MRLLLDTHRFLWFIGGDKRISAKKYSALPLHHRAPFDPPPVRRVLSARNLVVG